MELENRCAQRFNFPNQKEAKTFIPTAPGQLNISTNTIELQEVKHYLKKSIYTSYDELPLLLSVKQLVDLMGVSDSTIYELIQEDDFPSLRIGKRIVVPKEELRKWISAHTKGVQE